MGLLSTGVAAAIDIAVVGFALICALMLILRTTASTVSGLRPAAFLVGAALFAIASFYGADFWLLAVAPFTTSPTEALGLRSALHASWSWSVHVTAIALFTAGCFGGLRKVALERKALNEGVARAKADLEAREKEARRSVELFNKAASAGKAGTMEWSLQGGGEQRWSDNFHRLLGYEPGECEATHQTFVSLMHPDDVARVDAAVTDQFLEGRMLEIEFRLQHRTLGYRWFAATNQLVHEDGEPKGMLGTITDIHDLKTAQENAETANVAKSRFLANMSHEVRTPLNGIMGFANVLRGTELAEDQREYVETICSSGEQLLRLINEVLDLSKIEAGALALQEEPFPLADVIDDVLTLAKSRVRSPDVTLSATIDPAIPDRVLGDYGRLRQVLLNLVDNAAKFTHSGHITVTAAPGARAESVESFPVKITVTDTGIGIDAALLSRVFDPFVQADSSHTRKYGGTGLGLTICRDLARLMGGELEAQSEAGRGSAFSITIPFRVVRPVHDDAAARSLIDLRLQGERHVAPPPTVGGGAGAGAGARVLVVDDNATNCALLRAALTPAGFEVVTAADGAEAIGLYEGSHFDLVLMDIHLPVMDGLEAAAKMRALGDSRPPTPIIAVTADAMDGDRERYLAAGMDDYVSKPLDLNLLLEKVRCWARSAQHAHGDRAKAVAPAIQAAPAAVAGGSSDGSAGPAHRPFKLRTLDRYRNPDSRFVAIISEDPEAQLIRLSWVTDPESSTIVRKVHEALLAHLESGRYLSLLFDGRFLTRSFHTDEAWLFSEFVPRMFASGIIRKAVTFPKAGDAPGRYDVFAATKTSMETFASVPRYRDSGVEQMGFQDIDRAMAWLAETPRQRDAARASGSAA